MRTPDVFVPALAGCNRFDRRASALSSLWRTSALPLTVVLVLVASACAPDDEASRVEGGGPEITIPPEARAEGAQAVSFLGEMLFPPPLDPELRASREEDLVQARADLEAHPEVPENWIWVGRRQAYLGKYREAIETFTQGLERFPDDPRFHRHRGHRYLTVRDPARAREDLEEGLELALQAEDRVEPDGLPNVLGVPLSTLHFNLWYHLGLARYLQGDWEGAREAWEACLEVSVESELGNPDLEVATSYWLYLARHRTGNVEEANALLQELPVAEEVIENESYLQLLHLFRGDQEGQELLDQTEMGSLGGATLAYGVAMHHLLQGREAEARALMGRILEEPEQWPAFGYLAAEAEVARRGW